MKIPLQKFIANSGYCSRRKAEELIRNSARSSQFETVLVNGRPAELGMAVSRSDEVKIKGKKIELSKNKIYIKLNKPNGYTCTNRKFEGETNIFDLVKTEERLFVVGRLDKNSRGLILLTNDGELTQKLTHPKFEHEKKYQVEIKSQNNIKTENVIQKLKEGVDIGEGDKIVKAKKVRYLRNNKFEIILTEGKKRQIRRMFNALGIDIIDLVRVEISGLKLENLAEGKWEYLSASEIQKL